MLSVGHMLALTKMALVLVHVTVKMMAVPLAFLGILQLISAPKKKVEDGGSVSVAQLTCMEIGTPRKIIGDGHLASTGAPGEALSHIQPEKHA